MRKRILLLLSYCLSLLLIIGCNDEDEKNKSGSNNSVLQNTKWRIVKSQDVAEIAPQLYPQNIEDFIIYFTNDGKFGFIKPSHEGGYTERGNNTLSFTYYNALAEKPSCLSIELEKWEKLMYQSLITATGFTIESDILTIYCKDNSLFFERIKDDYIKQIDISNFEIFKYNVGCFGDEEGAIIQQQTVHHEISKLERNGDEVIYTYKPENGFTGEDYVEIKTARGSDGASPNNVIDVIKININVIEGLLIPCE